MYTFYDPQHSIGCSSVGWDQCPISYHINPIILPLGADSFIYEMAEPMLFPSWLDSWSKLFPLHFCVSLGHMVFSSSFLFHQTIIVSCFTHTQHSFFSKHYGSILDTRWLSSVEFRSPLQSYYMNFENSSHMTALDTAVTWLPWIQQSHDCPGYTRYTLDDFNLILPLLL